MKKLTTLLFILLISHLYAQVGIGTTNPQEKLEVNGKIRMTDTNQALGKVMTSDTNGTATWQDGTSNFSMVSAKIVNGGLDYTTDASNDWEKLKFNSEDFDTNNEFNVVSNTFTAQKAGYYKVEAQFVSELSNLTNQFGIGIYKNGFIFTENSYNHSGAGLIVRRISKLIYLAVNDTISIYISDNAHSIVIDKWSGKTFFSINRVR